MNTNSERSFAEQCTQSNALVVQDYENRIRNALVLGALGLGAGFLANAELQSENNMPAKLGIAAVIAGIAVAGYSVLAQRDTWDTMRREAKARPMDHLLALQREEFLEKMPEGGLLDDMRYLAENHSQRRMARSPEKR